MENINVFNFIEIYKNKLLEKLDNVIGIYLFGSLTYGGFDAKSSDIDLLVVTKTILNKVEIDIVKNIHEKLTVFDENWSKRFEVSYTPKEMFKDKNIPVKPRPYYNAIFYDEATYGNEWSINNYLLYKYGKAIYGIDFKNILEYKINMDEIIKSCINDFYKEWLPKLIDDEWLSSSHYQAYIILNICRIIYTISNSELANKIESAKWVKQKYPKWDFLIEEAESWNYGETLNKQNEIKEYLKYMDKIICEYKNK
jgi:predicted nucleotidyltransferase